MNTQLQVVDCTSLVPYDENPNAYREEFVLKHKIEEASEALDALQEFCKKVRRHLNSFDLEMLAEVERLTGILDTIKHEDGEVEDFEESDDTEDIEANAGKEFEKAQLKKLCKNIFLQISKKCHPDKTSNQHFHNLFHEAKLALEDLNIDELHEILALVVSSQSGIKSVRNTAREKISDKIRRLKVKLSNIENAIEKIFNDPEFVLYETYRTRGPHDARMFRQRLLLQNIDRLKQEILLSGRSDLV